MLLISQHLEVTIYNFEIDMIHSYIKSPVLQKELVDIYMTLNSRSREIEKFEFFTDGSLTRALHRSDPTTIMGAGFFNSDTMETFNCGIQLWPSSTRPELLAIWLCLLVLPKYASFVIKSDSQAVLNSIDGILHKDVTARSWFKMNNRSILMAIRNTFYKKNLTGSFVKVKGHSNIEDNDIADSQAKLGAKLEYLDNRRIIVLDLGSFDRGYVEGVGDLGYGIYWEKHLVDRHIRRFFRNVNMIYNATSWAMNQFNRSCTFNATDGHIYWRCTWNLFKSLRLQCTNTRAAGDLIQTFKITQNSLPTIQFMQHYFPSEYTNRLCLFCNQHSESISHLNKCIQTNNLWIEIEKTCGEKLRIYIKEKWNLTWPVQIIWEIFFDYHNSEWTATKEATRNNYVHGIMDKSTWLKLKKTSKSSKVAEDVAIKFLTTILNTWHSILWQKRCELIIQWKTANNITHTSASQHTVISDTIGGSGISIIDNAQVLSVPSVEVREFVEKEFNKNVGVWIALGLYRDWMVGGFKK